MRFIRPMLALGLATALAGCATSYLLESEVQAFATPAALPAAPTYRFERLPSQRADPAQAELEALADPALHQAGLRRDDAGPRFSVQLGSRVQRVVSPAAEPWDGWAWGWAGRGWGVGFNRHFPHMDPPWYQREVSVVVRDLATGAVVYETRATSDGPWFDNRSVLRAMFDAALQGFPAPPAGPRRVTTPIAR